MASNSPEPGAVDPSDWTPPRRWGLPVALVLVAVLAGAAAWFFLLRTPPLRPELLLVAVHTEDSKGAQGIWWGANPRASARFVDQWVKAYEKMGIEVVAAGSPDVLKALEGTATDDAALREAAAALGAAHALVGTIRLTTEHALGPNHPRDYTVELELRILPAEPAEPALPVFDEPQRFHTAASDPDAALLDIAGELPSQTFAPVAAALAAAPRLSRLNGDASGLTNEELAIGGKLESLFLTGKQWRDQLALRAEEARQEEARESEVGGGKPLPRLGAVLDEEYFVGPGEDGKVLVMKEPHYLQLPRGQGAYDLRRGHEQLVWVDPATNRRTPLLEVYNIFSYPSVSADGKIVAAVLDQRQYAKALVVVDGSNGAMRELVSDEHAYFSGPEVSPKGAWVAVWYREKRRAPSSLRVYPAAGGDAVELWPASDGQGFSVPSWLPDESALVMGVDTEGQRTSVWRVAVPGGERTAILGPAAHTNSPPSGEHPPAGEDDGADGEGDPGEDDAEVADIVDDSEIAPGASGFDRPAVGPDGKQLIATEYDDRSRWVSLHSLATGETKRLWEGRSQWFRWSPDGKWVAFETWNQPIAGDPSSRDTEVMLLDPESGTVKPITVNAIDDSVMGWSRDSRRIYFHQGSRDPDGDRWTNRVYWVDL